MLKRTILLALLSSLACTSQLLAQAGGNSVDVKLKIFNWSISNSVRLGGFGVSKDRETNEMESDIWYKADEKTYKKVDANAGAMSPQISYSGSRRMAFYKQDPSKKGEKDEFTEIASVNLPSGVNELFLLMYRKDRSVKFYPMNISPKELPKEKVAIMNMSPANIAMRVGGMDGILRAGSHAIFKPKNKKESFVEVQMARMVDKRWKPIYRGNVVIPEDKRCILMIFDPSNGKSKKLSVLTLAL